MEEFLGPLSPLLIATAISGLIQMVKNGWPNIQDRYLKVATFVLNMGFVIPYHMSLQADPWTWVDWFEAIFYGFAMGVWSTGFWATFIRPSERPRNGD